MQRSILARVITIGWCLPGLCGCEPALTPRTVTRLDEIRAKAPDGYGTFFGRVRAAPIELLEGCYNWNTPISGVRVDLGVWHGRVAEYRDSVTRLVPSTLNEPRFEVIASTTTNTEGEFQFEQLPRRMSFVFRAIPPPGRPYKVVYGMSLFGIGNVDIRNFPTLCLRPA